MVMRRSSNGVEHLAVDFRIQISSNLTSLSSKGHSLQKVDMADQKVGGGIPGVVSIGIPFSEMECEVPTSPTSPVSCDVLDRIGRDDLQQIVP